MSIHRWPTQKRKQDASDRVHKLPAKASDPVARTLHAMRLRQRGPAPRVLTLSVGEHIDQALGLVATTSAGDVFESPVSADYKCRCGYHVCSKAGPCAPSPTPFFVGAKVTIPGSRTFPGTYVIKRVETHRGVNTFYFGDHGMEHQASAACLRLDDHISAPPAPASGTLADFRAAMRSGSLPAPDGPIQSPFAERHSQSPEQFRARATERLLARHGKAR